MASITVRNQPRIHEPVPYHFPLLYSRIVRIVAVLVGLAVVLDFVSTDLCLPDLPLLILDLDLDAGLLQPLSACLPELALWPILHIPFLRRLRYRLPPRPRTRPIPAVAVATLLPRSPSWLTWTRPQQAP
jgi:hypothetical protein